MSEKLSFARSQPDLPGEGITASARAREAFAAARSARPAHEEALSREAEMVRKDRPHPAPRPSPDLAQGSDAESFNARWSAEKSEADRATRRSAYEAKRCASLHQHFKTRSQQRR